MLDARFIKENLEAVKANLKKRNEKEKLKWLDDLIKKDIENKDLLNLNQELRHKRNLITSEINQLRKTGKDISRKVEEAKTLPNKIKEVDEKIKELQQKIHYYLMRLPNILHKSVPIGKDSSENKEIRKWGAKPKFDFELKSHGELIEMLGLADFKKAAEVSGKGFSYLIGDLALMERALQNFAVDFLVKQGFKLIEPPLMLRKKPYECVTDLNDFENMMYKIEADEDMFLVATSEHPMASKFMNELIYEKDLPLKYCSISPCFRKEIGSHGIDERGLFRVHQFNKVEQFIVCRPTESWKFHEKLILNAEKLFQKLKLPYRIMNICTGDIGIVAAKKYDLEAWMPREKAYKEVVSCSNCTSYQSARLNLKYKKEKDKEKEYPHTLNSTAIATGRTLRAIIENYQQKDGTIKVPLVLQPYMGKIKVIGKNG